MSAGRIRVVIAEDHASVRAGIRMLLDTAGDIDVLGEAADGAAAVRQVKALKPDLVLMDARMPGMDGIAATAEIVGATRTDVIMLTTFDLDEVVFGALRAGAVGFLLKSTEPGELLAAIRRVAAGEGMISPEVTRKMLRHFLGESSAERGSPVRGRRGPTDAGTPGADDPGLRPEQRGRPERGPEARQGAGRDLTPRELEILRALARGRSNGEIAGDLFITRATVKTHVSSVLAKLGLRSRVQAAMYARESGLA